MLISFFKTPSGFFLKNLSMFRKETSKFTLYKTIKNGQPISG